MHGRKCAPHHPLWMDIQRIKREIAELNSLEVFILDPIPLEYSSAASNMPL